MYIDHSPLPQIIRSTLTSTAGNVGLANPWGRYAMNEAPPKPVYRRAAVNAYDSQHNAVSIDIEKSSLADKGDEEAIAMSEKYCCSCSARQLFKIM